MRCDGELLKFQGPLGGLGKRNKPLVIKRGMLSAGTSPIPHSISLLTMRETLRIYFQFCHCTSDQGIVLGEVSFASLIAGCIRRVPGPSISNSYLIATDQQGTSGRARRLRRGGATRHNRRGGDDAGGVGGGGGSLCRPFSVLIKKCLSNSEINPEFN